MKRNRQMFLFIGVLCVALLSGLVTGVSSAQPTSNTQLHPINDQISAQPPAPPDPNTGGIDVGLFPQVSPLPIPPADDNTDQPSPPPAQSGQLTLPPNLGAEGMQQSSPQNPPEPPNRNTDVEAQPSSPQIPAAIEITAASETTFFPSTGDTIDVQDDPWWWHDGDFAQGLRTLSINSVSGIRYELHINTNALSGSGHLDLDLSINGVVVGSFSVLPGETSKVVSFFFAPMTAPNYLIRLEETNTVDPGAGSVELLLDTSILSFYDKTTTLFPATDDTFDILSDPYWWNDGDYAQGVRSIGLNKVYGVRYELVMEDNSLNTTGHVDLDLSINGTVVGSFSINPSEMTKSLTFFFPPITGPNYTIRLEETNTVDPGAGSVLILASSSTLSFYGETSSWFPASGDQVDVGNFPYWWHAGDFAQGTRTPGLDQVTGVQLELLFDTNVLSPTGHVDLVLKINNLVVGSFSVLQGETSKTVSFFFAPIIGQDILVRLEETNTVDPGAGSVAIDLNRSVITFYDSTHSTYLPATGDIFNVASAPYWWHAGDHAQGTRFTSFMNITGIQYHLILSRNSLNLSGHVNLNLSINGIVVGSFSVLPGEMSKTGTMTFPPINGPIYVLRLEETNLVDPGYGSIVIPLDRSTIKFTTALFLPSILR